MQRALPFHTTRRIELEQEILRAQLVPRMTGAHCLHRGSESFHRVHIQRLEAEILQNKRVQRRGARIANHGNNLIS